MKAVKLKMKIFIPLLILSIAGMIFISSIIYAMIYVGVSRSYSLKNALDSNNIHQDYISQVFHDNFDIGNYKSNIDSIFDHIKPANSKAGYLSHKTNLIFIIDFNEQLVTTFYDYISDCQSCSTISVIRANVYTDSLNSNLIYNSQYYRELSREEYYTLNKPKGGDF